MLEAPARPLVCFLLDAFRHDYVGTHTPFLRQLVSDGYWARPLRPILGYSDSIRATIFTGRYPDEHGYWMEYCFRPERSPFKGFSKLARLDRSPSDFALRGLKYVLSRTVVPRVAKRKGYRHLDLRHLPFGAMRFFDWTLRVPMTSAGALGTPTIFDRLNQANLSWTYLDSSATSERQLLEAAADLSPGTNFLFVYLHHVDMASHLYGLQSARFRSSLARVDRLVNQIAAASRQQLGQPEFLIFSDHGMSPVTRTSPVPELRRHPDFPSKFCFALDGTMVRLWYLAEDLRLRKELREIVSGRLPGHFLSEDELSRFHLKFQHRLYGDDIFLVEQGTVIFPNFHSYVRPRAMHAYDPEELEQRGILIGPSRVANQVGDLPDLVDIAPLMYHLLGLTESFVSEG